MSKKDPKNKSNFFASLNKKRKDVFNSVASGTRKIFDKNERKRAIKDAQEKSKAFGRFLKIAPKKEVISVLTKPFRKDVGEFAKFAVLLVVVPGGAIGYYAFEVAARANKFADEEKAKKLPANDTGKDIAPKKKPALPAPKNKRA